MKLKVHLRGTLPSQYPGEYPEAGLELEFDHQLGVSELVDRIGIKPGRIGIISVNGLRANEADLIPDNAVVKIFQPLGGG